VRLPLAAIVATAGGQAQPTIKISDHRLSSCRPASPCPRATRPPMSVASAREVSWP
jgi:hypothetical protein